MAQVKHNSIEALAWAKSVLELANEKGEAQVIGTELDALAGIVRSNETFEEYLRDPGISEAERAQMLEKVFNHRVFPLVKNFLGVLNNRNRLKLLPAIADAFDDLLDAQLGKVEVDVTVAQKLSSAELEQVKKKVSAALKKDAVIHQYVDDSIIGGLVLRIGDQLIDASVKSQLQSMKEKLLAIRPA